MAIRAELVGAVFTRAGEALRQAAAVLDVGCGTGWWLARLAAELDQTVALHGIELLQERAQAAAARSPNATIVSGDACVLPYADHSFDVVTAFTVLSSLRDADCIAQALREARRVLAADGLLLIWEPRVPNPFNPATRLINLRAVRAALPDMTVDHRSITLFPPLARHLAGATDRLYPLLTQFAPLRTHRLICARQR